MGQQGSCQKPCCLEQSHGRHEAMGSVDDLGTKNPQDSVVLAEVFEPAQSSKMEAARCTESFGMSSGLFERMASGPSGYGSATSPSEDWVWSPAISSPETSATKVRSKVSKRSRLKKTLHLHMDSDILRAVPLQVLLKGFGCMWRIKPQQLTTAQLLAIHERSRKASGYDIFVSHTWVTSGWPKFWSMMLSFHSGKILFGWLMGTILAFAMTMSGVQLEFMDRLTYLRLEADTLRSYGLDELPEFGYAPASLLLGYLGAWIAFCLGPYLDAFRSRILCFLDVACISQTDPELRERGIYGIGGWLAVSKEMRILWSPPYFQRLWCVFELAAYRIANPEGKVVFQPVFVESIVIMIWTTCMAINCLETIASQMPREVSFLFYTVETLVPCVLVYALLRYMRLKLSTLAQLATFDLQGVTCSDEFDRDFVYSAIRGWYGTLESFRDYVRGPLQKELLEKLKINSLPFSYIIIVGTPFISLEMDLAMAIWNAKLEKVAVSYFFAMVLSRYLCTLSSVKLLFALVDCFAHREGSRLKDGLAAVIITIIIGAIYPLQRAVAAQAYNSGILFGVMTFAVTLLLIVLVFVALQCRK